MSTANSARKLGNKETLNWTTIIIITPRDPFILLFAPWACIVAKGLLVITACNLLTNHCKEDGKINNFSSFLYKYSMDTPVWFVGNYSAPKSAQIWTKYAVSLLSVWLLTCCYASAFWTTLSPGKSPYLLVYCFLSWVQPRLQNNWFVLRFGAKELLRWTTWMACFRSCEQVIFFPWIITSSTISYAVCLTEL